jgi:hypothetical protein
MGKSKKRGTFLATIFLTKNREGSHVGMIISFVIFITFVLFLYTIVKPAISIGESKTTTLTYIETKIVENVSANLTSVGTQIVSGRNPGNPCIQLPDFFAFLDINPLFSAIVKDENGKIQNAYKSVPEPHTNLVIDRKNKNYLFFWVYFSPEFPMLDESPVKNCDDPIKNYARDYNFSLVRTESYVYQENMYYLRDYYKSNYEDLKSQLKIPPGNEFGFSFEQSNGTIIEAGGEGTANVYVTQFPVQYFDETATVQSGFIDVKVW